MSSPRTAAVLLLLATLVAAHAEARPSRPKPAALVTFDPSEDPLPLSGLLTTASGAGLDTIWYGGTVWSADSSRWEAARGGTWTFDSGVGSAVPEVPGPVKPAGYHSLMEGWSGLDLSVPAERFRRTQECAIAGCSIWAGFTGSEADAECWASGRGYGNDWNVRFERSFDYPGSGDVTLAFDYAVESEPGFDYTTVIVDLTGDGSGEVELRRLTGSVSGHDTIVLTQAGGTLPAAAGPVRIVFQSDSDGSYSDEDGLYPTTCGHTVLDNVTLTGAIVHSADFESGLDGWTPVVPAGVGDFSDLRDVADLSPPTSFCDNCGLRDTVLVFFDANETHPAGQENVVVSPIIDLAAGGDTGRSGRLIRYDRWVDVPESNPSYLNLVLVRYYPFVCPYTGQLGWSPWIEGSAGPERTRQCGGRVVDISHLVAPGAERVQLGFGMENSCAPIFPCADLLTATPYFDNLRFAVFGPDEAPMLTTSPFARLQDNFATDGTLNPVSTGRVDVNRLHYPSGAVRLGDTLTVGGDGGNTEVRCVFRVRSGPFTSPTALAPWTGRWSPEPAIGPGWYSVRLDTAEIAGQVYPSTWMGTFHEDDPGFMGADGTLDPNDSGHLANEIFPDNVLTPGSRIDYFFKAGYRPPDPRNPGGAAWFITPDTTGGDWLEMEILPSSTRADGTWNCALYVDAHDGFDPASHRLEEQGLSIALGPRSGNAEGTGYDRWDVQAAGRAQLSLARQATADCGASLAQLRGYDTLVWHGGQITEPWNQYDIDLVEDWLTASGGVMRSFWGSGENMANRCAQLGGASLAFMNETLGTLLTCNTIYAANCPSGSVVDSTLCLPLAGASSPEFASEMPIGARGGPCESRAFDLLARNSTQLASRGQLAYVKNGVTRNFASITNRPLMGAAWRTVFDGFSVAQLRHRPADLNDPTACANTTPVLDRALDVLTWFNTPQCPVAAVSGIFDPPAPESAPPVTRLETASPNPMATGTSLWFTNARAGAPVRLEIFDVTGRPVRRVHDGPLPAGRQSLTWDGRDDRGQTVSSGLYWAIMTTREFRGTQKLIVVR